MRSLTITSLALVFAACATYLTPPPTPARPVVETLHGVTVTDPYRWLEDQNAPETRAWIDRQNAYTDAVLGHRPEQKRFAPRLEALLSTDQFATPIFRNGRYLYKHRGVGQDLYSIVMRRSANGAEEVLIDPAPLSPDHTTSVDIDDVTEDGTLLAYDVRRGGADEAEVRFFDIDAKHDTGAPLAAARYYGIELTPDRRMIYFTRAEASGPRLYRRAVAGGAEELLFGSGYTPDKIIYASLSDDARYLLIHVAYGSAPKKTEIYVDDLLDTAPPRTVVNDLDFRSYASLAGDKLVIQTNWNAPNDRVMVANLAQPQRDQWKEIVPENPKAAIQGVSLAGGKVFVSYLENVKPRITGYDLTGARGEDVSFETLGSLEDMSGTWSSPIAFFSFSSFHVPPTFYQYNVASRERTVFARQSAPVDPNQFNVEQVWYPSKDGTRVPMFVLTKKGFVRNGTAPTYLTGYGGFTSSSVPTYSSRAIAWVEQGGVYALANLRGGGEFGEAWHRAGMLEQKQHVFDDFIAAGEYLIAQHYTSSSHLGIAGGSNGGLLVMAAETQRPDLFGAVICRYPLIDMLRYDQFLVGSFWVPEYGSASSAADFPALYAYSPYQHVKQGTRYPATLFVTGDADTRVAPLHARKMTALMQASNGGDEPILLRYKTAAGHSGGEPLHVQVHSTAEELGFLWWQLTKP
ncbi:MAG: S9 family peptidase [Acidobacteria bacterium]|nr:S9 family peptidase [Acidobacteriota bacterium]MBV9474629.1 S9 family peptidase [Acidobacteriota bacterium]